MTIKVFARQTNKCIFMCQIQVKAQVNKLQSEDESDAVPERTESIWTFDEIKCYATVNSL